MLIRPRPGFYVMHFSRCGPLVPALMNHFRPIVIPQLTEVDAPNPEEWCRPLDRSPQLRTLVDGKLVAVDRIWTEQAATATDFIAPCRMRMVPIKEKAEAVHQALAPTVVGLTAYRERVAAAELRLAVNRGGAPRGSRVAVARGTEDRGAPLHRRGIAAGGSGERMTVAKRQAAARLGPTRIRYHYCARAYVLDIARQR